MALLAVGVHPAPGNLTVRDESLDTTVMDVV
jgi:hypothetical protein